MAYISLYRKWRPQSFGDVEGQDSIVKTLKNSLDSGRISHAYLFAGPRGTGKTTVARLLAKGLNCHSGPTSTPCGTCEECEGITFGTSLNVVEIDGASNRGIDDVRELRGQVQYTPINAKYKVYIIDEVHMLTTEAFNALLKTLEEPPPHVIFIFATTDPHRLPPTILSRVQRYDFQRFSQDAMIRRLETVVKGEGFSAEKKALQLMAEHAEGGMRDALSILEKCAAFSSEITAVTVEEVLGIAPREQVQSFTQFILEGSKVEALQLIDALHSSGRDLAQFVRSTLSELRTGLLQHEQEYEDFGLRAIEVLSEALREMRFAPDPRIPLEVATLKIATEQAPFFDHTVVHELQEKIRTLEQEFTTLKDQMASGQFKSSGEPSRATAPRRPLVASTDAERTAQILELWPDYLRGLRQEKLMQCEAFLKEGTPVEASSNALVVAFPRDRGFHKASIEQDNHREPAERVLAKLVGTTLHLKCVFQDEVESFGEQSAPAPKPVPKRKPRKVQKETTDSANSSEEPTTADDGQTSDSQKFIEVSLETFGGKIFTKPKKND